jgi:hypothetical protein
MHINESKSLYINRKKKLLKLRIIYWINLDQLKLTCQIYYSGHEIQITQRKAYHFLLKIILNQPNHEG